MKIDRLKREAERLQAGRKRRSIRLDLGGEALDAWDSLLETGARKGMGPAEVLALLLVRGGGRVAKILSELPDVKAPSPTSQTA